MKNKGFTLIELLVVMGIIGILAAGLVVAVNPVEQFRKAEDSNRKQAAVELVNALLRYNSANNTYPWLDNPGDGCYGVGLDPLVNGGGQRYLIYWGPCIQKLITSGELKSTFSGANYTDQMIVSISTGSPTVCFEPTSLSGKNDALTRYDAGGNIQASCPATGTCFWCAR